MLDIQGLYDISADMGSILYGRSYGRPHFGRVQDVASIGCLTTTAMHRPHWHPSPTQELLLKACLLPDDQAIPAWNSWLQVPTAQRSDPASQRLFPLLWSRVNQWQADASGTGDPEDTIIWKKAMLETWALNQRRLAHANQIAEDLSQAGIPLLLVKGLPLALVAYGHLGLRPMGDLDLVVPDAQARQSLDVLTAAGWVPLPTPLKGSDDPGIQHRHPWILENRHLEDFDELYFRVRNGHGLRHPDGTEADLHWHVFHEQCDSGVDNAIWENAHSLQHWNRRSQYKVSPHLCMPDPVEHLLLILAHASRWDKTAPIRWVADAVLLVRAVDHFDWPRFVHLAHQRKLAAPAGALLAYLHAALALNVDVAVLSALNPPARSPAPRRLLRRSRPDVWGGGEELLYLLSRWHRLKHDRHLQETVPGFFRFLCHVLGIPSRRELLTYAVHESQRRSP